MKTATLPSSGRKLLECRVPELLALYRHLLQNNLTWPDGLVMGVIRPFDPEGREELLRAFGSVHQDTLHWKHRPGTMQAWVINPTLGPLNDAYPDDVCLALENGLLYDLVGLDTRIILAVGRPLNVEDGFEAERRLDAKDGIACTPAEGVQTLNWLATA